MVERDGRDSEDGNAHRVRAPVLPPKIRGWSKSAAARMAYSERVTWVRAHPGWTILIVLAIAVVVYVLFNVGGSTGDSFEIQS
jgi:hypothetical protein